MPLSVEGAATICEHNLQKTFSYGGRKSPPSQMEFIQLMVRVFKMLLLVHRIETKFVAMIVP